MSKTNLRGSQSTVSFSSASSDLSTTSSEAELWQDKFLVEDDYVWTLPEEMKEVAQREVGETEQLRNEGLAYMRDFIRNDPRLGYCRRDANFLLRFLRMKKFNFEAATDTLEKYLRMRAEIPEWYQNLDIADPALDDLISSGCSLMLPGKDFEGRSVVFHSAKMFNTSKYGASHLIRSIILTLESALENEENQIRGFTYIFDFKDVSVPYISVWTPTQFHKVISQGERFLPMRHQSVNLVNQPMGFFIIYEFAKHVLSDKIKARMTLHRSDKTMRKLLPLATLPREYGGQVPLCEMGSKCKQALLTTRSSVLGLDRMVVEYENVSTKLVKKQSSWASLSRWFSKQRNVAATTEEVKAEWNGSSFKVPPGLPFWMQAILALPGLPKIIQRFSNEEDLVNEFEGYVEHHETEVNNFIQAAQLVTAVGAGGNGSAK